MTLRHAWSVALVVASCAMARGGQPLIAGQSCVELARAKLYEAALDRCTSEFLRTRDALTGARAAWVANELGRYDRVFGLAEQLSATSQAGSAWVTAGLGQAALGRDDRALEAFTAAVDALETSGDNPRTLYAAHKGIARVQRRQTNYREAIQNWTMAYEVAERAGLEWQQGEAAVMLGSCFQAIGDLRGVAWTLQLSSPLVESHGMLRAMESELRGLLQLNEGRLALARATHEKTLTYEFDSAAIRRASHLNLVNLNVELGDLDRAEAHLREAETYVDTIRGETEGLIFFRALVAHARNRHDDALRELARIRGRDDIPEEWQWRPAALEGRILAGTGRPNEAQDALNRAIAVIEELRLGMGLGTFRAWILEKMRDPYEMLVGLQLGDGDTVGALSTTERVKARTLVDTIASPAPDETGPTGPEPLRHESFERLDMLENLLPSLHAAPVVSPRPADAVLAELQDRHVLSYFQAGGTLWLFVSAGPRAIEIAAGEGELSDLVSRFSREPDDVEIADRLGTILLPDSALPAENTHLYISTDRSLKLVPFAALRIGGRYLVERHSLSYVPSLTALGAIERTRNTVWSEPVVLGDPASDLPAAREEAHAVAHSLGVDAITGVACDRAALARAGRASVLHAATHAGLDTAGGWIQLSDGRLHADTIVAERIAPRLVVLASCSSASTNNPGTWSALTSSFLASGSRAVVAALWPVDDRTTRDFVLDFYSLEGARDPTTALARAQRRWIASGVPPDRWAAYVVMGGRTTEVQR